ncbi:hypothetical protein TanjilG_06498 [Lupinus angustifolius]|uniref:Uncharacterized protein n=1 Tax=Lupinus angustifolius TaxID=3871 RepID=A0A4P1RF42_LUPAN|nr:hypothetical protein TanjilG_06498 [Lupinus angustifolius]
MACNGAPTMPQQGYLRHADTFFHGVVCNWTYRGCIKCLDSSSRTNSDFLMHKSFLSRHSEATSVICSARKDVLLGEAFRDTTVARRGTSPIVWKCDVVGFACFQILVVSCVTQAKMCGVWVRASLNCGLMMMWICDPFCTKGFRDAFTEVLEWPITEKQQGAFAQQFPVWFVICSGWEIYVGCLVAPFSTWRSKCLFSDLNSRAIRNRQSGLADVLLDEALRGIVVARRGTSPIIRKCVVVGFGCFEILVVSCVAQAKMCGVWARALLNYGPMMIWIGDPFCTKGLGWLAMGLPPTLQHAYPSMLVQFSMAMWVIRPSHLPCRILLSDSKFLMRPSELSRFRFGDSVTGWVVAGGGRAEYSSVTLFARKDVVLGATACDASNNVPWVGFSLGNVLAFEMLDCSHGAELVVTASHGGHVSGNWDVCAVWLHDHGHRTFSTQPFPCSPCVISASVFNYGSCVSYLLSGIHAPLKTCSIQTPSRGCWRIRK